MVGLPSQLGMQIIQDICKKTPKLSDCCCDQAALALWSLQLPVNVRAHISDMEFNKDTYKRVFESADRVFNSAKQVTIAAMTASSLDETLPAFDAQNQPVQVAAMQKKPAKSGNQQGKGKNKNNKNNKPQGSKPRPKRHASMPPEACCDRHYQHGADSWYCLSPATCPWAERVTPKP